MSTTSMIPPVLPPLNKDTFVPDVIEFNLKHNPEHPFYTWSEPNAANRLAVITHLEFGRAAHRIAHILRPNRTGDDGEVVAFIVLADTILYQAITSGLIVAGLVPFPISPRNSPAAVVNLLEKTSCRRLVTTNITLKPLIDAVKAQIAGTSLGEELQIEEIPSLTAAFPNLAYETAVDPFEPYPKPSNRPSKDDLCAYVHSSGSMGFPKAIPQTYRAWTEWARASSVWDYREHRLGCMALPSFHALGIGLQLLVPLYGIVSVTVYPPTAMSSSLLPVTPSPENIIEHARLTQVTVLVAIPSFLLAWATSPEAITFLRTLKLIVYGGGSLTLKIGDHLVKAGVRLRSAYGGTEFGAPSHFIPAKGEEKDWEYVRVGRIDDVITHSSGEKTVPAPMEDVVISNPIILLASVQAAVMFGRERDQTGILVEPKPGHNIDTKDNSQVAELRNKLWPTIEEANKAGPTFSRIFKEMILITSKDKPLPRTGKGTIMRKAALTLYEKEIDALYDAVETSIRTAENVNSPATWSVEDVQQWMVQQAVDLTSGSSISPSVDLFEQGFDSLSATFLRLRIIGALRLSGDQAIQKAAQDLTQSLVYSYPKIEDLAAHVSSLYASPGSIQDAAVARGKALIESLIDKYTAGLEGFAKVSQSVRSTPAVVLLTGSTGNLGSEVLAALLKDERVERVYAFNRPSKGVLTIMDRHVDRFKDRGLDTALLTSDKLVYVSGDATEANLGLDRGQYGLVSLVLTYLLATRHTYEWTSHVQLCRSVNVVIHNAWKLDFNLSLASFESNIQGTRHLLDLIRSGSNASSTRFIFTSSIASTQSWDTSDGPVPEEILLDASSAIGGGYGEAKYVADRILAKSGLHTTSLRVGQISGGQPKGAWATSDWVPILVKSSVALGILPQVNGVVSWLPVDGVAGGILDIALGDKAPPPMLNLVHPRPVEWSNVIAGIKTAIKEVLGRNLEVVPFGDWVSALEAHADTATAETMDSIPALKLLDFFRGVSRGNDSLINPGAPSSEIGGLASFVTDTTLEISGVIRSLPQLGDAAAGLWVRYWYEVGFLC
ncbi:putative NRPS-like protein biosynthetic cluster [Sphagnurus paluster]|uniref:NRPS-like protein biosynthetic cluster n=1 Tax=Sphagnurus paluster TaxID=117069 RepID=A0A9P7GM55_9AGAR|nr:putative NRPS-like protein biosynthetic cluster [Sphagnurus paluster]